MCGFDLWVRQIIWGRTWKSTPVCLPGESHGQESLVGSSSWGCKESDMTEPLTLITYAVWNGQNPPPPKQEKPRAGG